MKRLMLFLPMLLLIVLSLFLMAARPLQAVEPTDLTAVLVWFAAGPGAVVAALYVVSHVLEWIPAWGLTLSGFWRGAIIMGLSIAFAFGAYFLVQAPPVIAAIQPYFRILVLTILAFAGSQWAFLQQKGAGDLTRPKTA